VTATSSRVKANVTPTIARKPRPSAGPNTASGRMAPGTGASRGTPVPGRSGVDLIPDIRALNPKIRILVVEARFYDDLADALLEGATQALSAFGAEYDVVTVPGALEIPGAIALAEEAGHKPAGKRYDGYVALGTVIRGETYHFEIVSDQSAAGITRLGLKGLAIGNGILTTEDEDQAWARARISEGDKGGGAARACLDLIALRKRLRVGLGEGASA